MITRTEAKGSLLLVCLVCCELLFGSASPANQAFSQGFTYYTSVSSEAKSHWNPSLNISDSAVGTRSISLDYHPTLDSGTFSSRLRTESDFGLFRLYGTFALDGYTPGSNVSLVQPDGGWSNNPLYIGAWLVDYITVSSQDPSVDLTLPIVMRGSFSKSGTPMDNGDLGAIGDIGFTLQYQDH